MVGGWLWVDGWVVDGELRVRVIALALALAAVVEIGFRVEAIKWVAIWVARGGGTLTHTRPLAHTTAPLLLATLATDRICKA